MENKSIAVTFRPKVTRDQLIATLDKILKNYGCVGCGLNGKASIVFQGDPDPEISIFRSELIRNELISNVSIGAQNILIQG